MKFWLNKLCLFWILTFLIINTHVVFAQTPPSANEVAAYQGLLKAAHQGEVDTVSSLIKDGADLEVHDNVGRTPTIVATFASNDAVIAALAIAGANLNALEHQAYDIVTIAAVANDLELLDLVLNLGASASNITSPYEGTALIAAAHLGHHQVVARLIKAKAPLDHVNNLGWTALIEAVILGDGGPAHLQTVKELLAAGADVNISDAQGVTPIEHAQSRGYGEMVALLGNIMTEQ